MRDYPRQLEILINELSKLPGVGEKSAQRLAFHILDKDEKQVEALADSMLNAKRQLRHCSICGNLTDSDPCKICSDPGRRKDLICVVETPRDVMAMERIGIGPEDINLKSLIKRLQTNDCEEVIIATNPTIQGEATAMYISKLLKPAGIKVSRIAHGVPVGSDLEFADEVTLLKSFEGRREL